MTSLKIYFQDVLLIYSCVLLKVADYSGRVLAASTVTPAARLPLMPTSYSGVAKNIQPKVVGDEFGTYQIQEGDDFGTAVGKQFVEVQSEGVGEFFCSYFKRG